MSSYIDFPTDCIKHVEEDPIIEGKIIAFVVPDQDLTFVTKQKVTAKDGIRFYEPQRVPIPPKPTQEELEAMAQKMFPWYYGCRSRCEDTYKNIIEFVNTLPVNLRDQVMSAADNYYTNCLNECDRKLLPNVSLPLARF